MSIAAARRVAISAQGLAGSRPARVGDAALRRAIASLGVLQIDSVNVFERSHYLPLLARLGPYDRSRLDRLLHHDTGRGLGGYTEYVAHEATVLPVADWPLWAWHRQAPRSDHAATWAAGHQGLLSEVRAEFADRGPLRVRDLEHPSNVSLGGGWWNRNDVHWAANWLFRRGELVVVGRQRFERRFALADHVLPPGAMVEVPRDDAVREVIRRAARAYGVATLDDLADYPRLRPALARPAVDDLVAAGELEPVTVDGWSAPAYLAAGTVCPARCTGGAAVAVRSARLVPAAGRAAVRVPLPHLDLHAGRAADARLLRAPGAG
nr:crosslink repair DNA glycosylase YcaQ family protein [Tessaracoccus coleopterorum]